MGTPLDHGKYVSLETFRKDGSGVRTPMWAAPLDGKLVMATSPSSHKVKRIRQNPRVRVAICNASGSQILGPWYEGQALLVDESESARSDAALNAKYGLLRRAGRFFGKLLGKSTAFIEITVENAAAKNP